MISKISLSTVTAYDCPHIRKEWIEEQVARWGEGHPLVRSMIHAEFHSLGGLELTDAYVDESAQVSKRAIDILQSRIRFKLREYNLPPKMLLTCNPSKGWLYNEFYAPFKNDSLPGHLAFIPSLPTDNPHLPETYIETLERLPEIDRRRLLHGDWEYDESIDNLYQYDDLVRCFRDEESKGDKYISADIARLGKDRTVICVWHGLHLIEIHELRKQMDY